MPAIASGAGALLPSSDGSGRQQPARDQRREPLAEAHLLVELIDVLHAELAERGLQGLRAHLVERQLEFAQRLVDEPLAERDGLRAPQALQVVPDGAARLGRDHEIHPRRIGLGALGRDDLDRLAVAQHGAQRHQAPVHLGGDAAIADVRVHGVGEIDDGRAARQAQDLALGREHVDLVGEQVDLDALEEFLGAAALLQLHQVREPLARALLLHGVDVLAHLVFPVRGDAGLGDAMHVVGADLHFDAARRWGRTAWCAATGSR